MTKLTRRQQEILTLIQTHMEATGSPPTRAEIAKSMGFRSPNAAEDHLRALARKGAIELIPGTSRGIRLPHNISGIPVVKLDRIGTHQPILSDAHLVGNCHIDRTLFTPSIDYMVDMSRKAIPELNILAGDYLAIHQSQKAQVGQLVLVRSYQELSVQRYTADLQTQNRSMALEGLVVAVIRNLSGNPCLT